MKRNKGSAGLATKKYAKRSAFGEMLHKLRKHKGAMVGLIIFSIVLLSFILSLFFINYDMVTIGSPKERLSPPSWRFPFGTDNMGRNMFFRLLYGSRYSLALGFGGSLIGAFFGVGLGSIAGYYGGIRETLIMRFADILSSIPAMLFGIVLMSTLGSNLQNLIYTVGIASTPIYIRMTRASMLTLKNQEFVEAAHAIGLRDARIILTHILPNGLSPIIVTFTMNFGLIILAGSGLSFLGFGVTAPRPEWGALIAGGRQYMRNSPFLLAFPGLIIMLTVLAFNLVGDGLRDALDPKQRR